MLVLHEGVKNVPKSRVELHIHLDGALRVETAWDLLRRKGLPLPGDGSLASLAAALKVEEPSDLCHFLAPFSILGPAIQGDLEAIHRVSVEFVEDRSRDHIAYCEARFCPQLLLPAGEQADPAHPVTVDDITATVLAGLQEGCSRCPGTKVRVILCCIRGQPQWSWEVLRLCKDFRSRGVVGIDIAGSHCGEVNESGDYAEGAEVFQAAEAAGISRTVHAGEDAPAESVKQAVDCLKACRIGHGYRVVEDQDLYERCLADGLHFEVCPTSSYLTGAIGSMQTASKQHPVIRFAADSMSFSVNTDDPTLTQTTLTDEYALLRGWGFTEALLARANFSAAAHSFLPDAEKEELLTQLRAAYGVPEPTLPTPPSVSAPPTPSPPPPQEKPNITVNAWGER